MATRESLVSGMLAPRFRHYCEPVPFLAETQPGSTQVEGQTYPALLLANDCFWFPIREARPEGKKTKAPKGVRRILVAQPEEAELLVVEGEGDAMAAAFVGYTGLVVAGGVNNLLSAVPEAIAERRVIFKDKAVRILFDPDEPGRKAAVHVARQLLNDGAAKVAILEPPGGEDLEDWLETFADRGDALRELTALVASTDWATDKTLEARATEAEKETKAERVVSERIFVGADPWPRLVVTVYDTIKARAQLAKYGPTKEPELPRYGDIDWSGVERAWEVGHEFTVGDRRLIPAGEEDVLRFITTGTLVLPPPPPTMGILSSVELWCAVREFMRKWVVHAPDLYNVQVAYVFLTYRLEDARFQRVPYLRFYGPSGSGKNRALDVIKHLVWRGFFTQPSSNNLHRLIDYLGDITLIMDEFHLDRGRTAESKQNVIDILNYGNDRASVITRVVETKGNKQGLRHFRVFGPKVFAGYGVDEEDNLARRTVTVEMAKVNVPDSMAPLGLPPEFYAEAEYLRGQLLAFRGRKLMAGQPDPVNHPVAQRLVHRAGLEVAQTLFPLLSMVPESMPEVLEELLVYAEGRREAVASSKGHSEDAHLIECFVRALHGREAYLRDGVYYCTAREVVDKLEALPTLEVEVGKRLRGLGFPSSRPRWIVGRPRVFSFDPNYSRHREILERYSVSWDIEDSDKPQEDGGL